MESKFFEKGGIFWLILKFFFLGLSNVMSLYCNLCWILLYLGRYLKKFLLPSGNGVFNIDALSLSTARKLEVYIFLFYFISFIGGFS